MLVAAFDPGRNIGFALVDGSGRLLAARVLDAEELGRLELPEGTLVVVGDGTGRRELERLLGARGLEVAHLVDEQGTSLEARRLYFEAHPPPLLLRWLPRGLWHASRPIDDYAAYAIALRFLAGSGRRGGNP